MGENTRGNAVDTLQSKTVKILSGCRVGLIRSSSRGPPRSSHQQLYTGDMRRNPSSARNANLSRSRYVDKVTIDMRKTS
ncbi:hypothetical protein RRG08_045111 [Elysia crispata]|uniref:Uncharacterized protein n=1 Tax=Elysia crispata TaxID=231223 RepID=A0AAE1D424_9GAST|nr:hypothetical protein RRG08_045111 [Elysia crispata]